MIKCLNLCVDYTHDKNKSIAALNNLSFDIRDSEFIGVIGPNGSGKSTLAFCVAGLQPLTSGTIEIDGRDIHDLIKTSEIRDVIGIVFQNPDDQLLTNMVEHEIAFALENRSVPKDEMVKRVDEIMHRFQIADLKGQSPNQLSGGQKQKLALASVMIANPKYLILDEPTSFLDMPDRRMILRQLRVEFQERAHEGFSIIFITQFPREAAACSRIIVLDNGQIAADDTPENLFTTQQTLFNSIGVEVPIEYQIKKAVPGIQVPANIFDYSINNPA